MSFYSVPTLFPGMDVTTSAVPAPGQPKTSPLEKNVFSASKEVFQKIVSLPSAKPLQVVEVKLASSQEGLEVVALDTLQLTKKNSRRLLEAEFEKYFQEPGSFSPKEFRALLLKTPSELRLHFLKQLESKLNESCKKIFLEPFFLVRVLSDIPRPPPSPSPRSLYLLSGLSHPSPPPPPPPKSFLPSGLFTSTPAPVPDHLSSSPPSRTTDAWLREFALVGQEVQALHILDLLHNLER